MPLPPSKDDTLLAIEDRAEFGRKIKDSVLKCYSVTFSNYKEFMDVYDDTRITIDIIEFWINQYTFLSDNGKLHIYSSDYENLIGRVYKEYCQCMMNKLVDSGHLQLMWDKKKKIVFWKKIKV